MVFHLDFGVGQFDQQRIAGVLLSGIASVSKRSVTFSAVVRWQNTEASLEIRGRAYSILVVVMLYLDVMFLFFCKCTAVAKLKRTDKNVRAQ